VILGIADNRDTSAVFRDRIALGDGVGGVVGAFGLDVGADLANDGADVEFVENNHGVDIGERGYDLSSLFSGHDGTARSLERPDRFIGIDRDYEFPAKSFGSAQIADMTDMQQIEVAVGQRNGFARQPPFFYAAAEFVSIQDFIVGVQLYACN
jgi:hypothetical protein